MADGISDPAALPDERAEASSLQSDIHGLLRTSLSDRECDVVRLRFGLDDGRARTLEEIGTVFRITREPLPDRGARAATSAPAGAATASSRRARRAASHGHTSSAARWFSMFSRGAPRLAGAATLSSAATASGLGRNFARAAVSMPYRGDGIASAVAPDGAVATGAQLSTSRTMRFA